MAACIHGPACVYCHPELPRTAPELVAAGTAKVTQPFLPPVAVQEAWRASPPDTFELLMAELRLRAGGRGRRQLTMVVVLDGDEWTETHFPQPPKVTRRRRRPLTQHR